MSNLSSKFTQLAEKIRSKAAARVVTKSIDTTTVGGLTVAQVRSGVTKADVGLGSVPNLPLAAPGSSVEGLVTPALASAELASYLPVGNPGEIAIGNGSNFSSLPPLAKLSVVSSTAELTAAQSATESFEDVFLYWRRFSHRAGYPQPGVPSELNDWTYDVANDVIRCTVNSVSHIGFVSPDKYNDYEFEVEVSSTDGDDDVIGIVLAFVEEGGVEQTLTAFRVLSSATSNTFQVHYNYGITGGRGIAGNKLGQETNPHANPNGNGWSGKKSRIRAIRTGDIIKVSSTLLDSTEYVQSSEIVIDLNSSPDFAKFKGAVGIGYMCQSQRYSSWKTFQRPGARNAIVDLRNYQTRIWTGTGWAIQSAAAYQQLLKPGRFYFNELSGKLYYCKGNKDVLLLGQRGV